MSYFIPPSFLLLFHLNIIIILILPPSSPLPYIPPLNTHTVNDEDPGEAEGQDNAKDHSKAEVHDDEEDKVEVVISPDSDKTEETDGTLTETEER